MTDIFIGIDPGKTGAVGIIEGSKLIEIIPTPTLRFSKGDIRYDMAGMNRIVERINDMGTDVRLCAIEQQHAMPAVGRGQGHCPGCGKAIPSLHIIQGAVSLFTTGLGYGLWLGLLQGRIPYREVPAKTWQKAMFTIIGRDTKASSVVAASALFPGQKFVKSRHGEADAALLAAWARDHQ